MTKEERRQYNHDYNREGFKRLANRRYYMKHREQILETLARKRKQKNT